MKKKLLLLVVFLIPVFCFLTNVKAETGKDYVIDFQNKQNLYDLSLMDAEIMSSSGRYLQTEQNGDIITYKNTQGKSLLTINTSDYSISVCDGVTGEDNLSFNIRDLLGSDYESILIEMPFISDYEDVVIKFDGQKNNQNDELTIDLTSLEALYAKSTFFIQSLLNQQLFSHFSLVCESRGRNMTIKTFEDRILFEMIEGTINATTANKNDNIYANISDEMRAEFAIPSQYKKIKIIFSEDYTSTNGIYVNDLKVVDDHGIYIESTFNRNSISISTELKEINDYIKYEVEIVNNTDKDYEINFDNIKSDYIKYLIEYENGSSKISAHSKKKAWVTVKYVKAIPANLDYIEEKNIVVKFTESSAINPATITGRIIIVASLLLIISLIVLFISFKKYNTPRLVILILSIMITIPFIVNALTKVEITIYSKVRIRPNILYTLSYNKRTPINAKIPKDLQAYATAGEAKEEWKTYTANNNTVPFYIKYGVDSKNIIKDSSIEFIVTDTMASANPGMVAGTYTIKKANSASDIEANIQTIKTAFGYETHTDRCNIYTDGGHCDVEGLSASVELDYIQVTNKGRYGCVINSSYSQCYDDYVVGN